MVNCLIFLRPQFAALKEIPVGQSLAAKIMLLGYTLEYLVQAL